MSKLQAFMSETIKFLLEVVSERPAHSIPIDTVKTIIHLGVKEKIRGFFPKKEY
ncbi:hypothetical protein [Nitrosomonas sp. Nm33]|uniref:hypothetical protein n=1 Tax=Nitrosomonas sp. Nm33 TaxID=133724 RepID=UPI0015A164A6|nr:hypothetical protein [Nitrosomonas sp. Nm33]